MRSVVQHEFGPPEVLKIEELPAPEPIPTEVQVRVHAAGVNPVDFKTRAGRGSRMLGEPPFTVGWDVSGVVTEVGGGVTRFEVGDEVFGMPWFPREAAAYSEFVTAPSRHFAGKPGVFSHEEAGALPLAGLTAWQIVVDTIKLQAGRLSELGAGRVIDYRDEDFEQLVSDLDAVIDFTGAYGERSLRVLRPGGMLVSVPSGAARDLVEKGKGSGRRVTGFLVEPDPVGLAGLTHLIEDGRLQVDVDRVFDLEDAAEAHRAAEEHHGGGKIVLRVA